ncbi:ladderlectin-like [Mytilus trossulus]|uniref:ladderlectin-like n=1 Tax=Mytilus trossulus TaxID=6551 RepID=UPI003004D4C6
MYCVIDFTGNWYTAQKMCSSISAHLPVADTAEAFKRIGDVTGRSNDIWLDGTDEHHPNQWKWQSTGLDFRFQHWAIGEPNDGTEHCLEVVARTEWHWNDGHCEQTGRVNKLVCERYELTAHNVIG